MPPFMKPAFADPLELSNDRKTVTATGPFSLDGNETDAYFWVRIAQPPEGAKPAAEPAAEEEDEQEAEGIATLEMEKAALETEFGRVQEGLLEAVAGALAASDERKPEERASDVRDAVETVGPTWVQTATAGKGGTFHDGPATAEAWLLVRTGDDPPRDFQTYWRTTVTLERKL